jgi:sugar-specific transcriptional regulator TrmB
MEREQVAVEERQVSAIQRLGLTEYESRAYLALIKMGPSKASELSFFAQIPRSKTYGALKELARKGLLRAIPGKPELYSAVSPSEGLMPIINTLHHRLKDSEDIVVELDLVHEASRYVKQDLPKECVEFWETTNRQALVTRLNQAFLEARESIHYATSSQGLIRAYKAHSDTLEEASSKGVKVMILAPMSADNMLVAEQFADIVSMKRLDRSFNMNFVSVDSKRLVVVDSRPDDFSVDKGADLAVWTTNRLLIDLHEQFFERLLPSLPMLEIHV